MPKIQVSQTMFQALAKIAEHEGTTINAAAGARLYRMLQQERADWIAAHPPSEVGTQDVPVGSCTEENLRSVCGDQWELCWWALGCWALPG